MTAVIRSPSRRAASPRYTCSNMNARSLAQMAEGRVAEVVAEADRLGEVLVETQRPGHRARDLRDLEGVGQARPVVVALGRHEHLRLVLEPPERLAVHDPVPIALEGSAQRAVLLGAGPSRRVGAGRARVQLRLLQGLDPFGESR